MQEATLQRPHVATGAEAEPAGVAGRVYAIDPNLTYDIHALAAALRVCPRTIRRWHKQGRNKFPRPFSFMGRPHWRGHTIIAWQDTRQQQEAA